MSAIIFKSRRCIDDLSYKHDSIFNCIRIENKKLNLNTLEMALKSNETIQCNPEGCIVYIHPSGKEHFEKYQSSIKLAN